MNIQLLAADIVKRVQHSPDNPQNCAEVVAGLIENELNRADFYRDQTIVIGTGTPKKFQFLLSPPNPKS